MKNNKVVNISEMHITGKINMYKYLFEIISNGVENYVCLFSQNNLFCKCSMLILFIKYSAKIITFDSLNIYFTRINSLNNVDIIHGCIEV